MWYLNDGGQGELWEADGAGLSVEVFQYQVIQLVNQPFLKRRRTQMCKNSIYHCPFCPAMQFSAK